MRITYIEVHLEEQGEGFTAYLEADASGILQFRHISAHKIEGPPKADPERLVNFILDQFGPKVGVAFAGPWEGKTIAREVRVWFSTALEKKAE